MQGATFLYIREEGRYIDSLPYTCGALLLSTIRAKLGLHNFLLESVSWKWICCPILFFTCNGAYLCTQVFLLHPQQSVFKIYLEWENPSFSPLHPKRVEGIGVPTLRKYYEAIALQRILDWYHSVSTKLWVPLEKLLAGRNLSHASWLPREGRGLSELTTHNYPCSEMMGCLK